MKGTSNRGIEKERLHQIYHFSVPDHFFGGSFQLKIKSLRFSFEVYSLTLKYLESDWTQSGYHQARDASELGENLQIAIS
jgi:hypothetical protein